MSCRLCLTHCSKAILISKGNDENNWFNLIYKYLSVKIELDDVRSTYMCTNCHKILKDFHIFYKFIHTCQLNLEKMQATRNKAADSAKVSTDKGIMFKEEMMENEVSETSNMCQEGNQSFSENNDKNQNTDILQLKAEILSSDEESINCEPSNKSLNESAKTTKLSGNETIICDSCGTGLKDINNRACEICSKKSFNLDEDIEKRFCHICCKLYSSKSNMKGHMRRKHNQLNEIIANRTCPICKTVHSDISTLKQHMYRQHNKKKKESVKSRTCPICNKIYSSVRNMKSHQTFSHSIQDIQDRTCPICSKVFKKTRDLTGHIFYVHNNAKPFACEFCNKAFVSRPGLRAHSTSCLGVITNNIKVNQVDFSEVVVKTEKNSENIDIKSKKCESAEETYEMCNNTLTSTGIVSKNEFTYTTEEISLMMEIKQEDSVDLIYA